MQKLDKGNKKKMFFPIFKNYITAVARISKVSYDTSQFLQNMLRT